MTSNKFQMCIDMCSKCTQACYESRTNRTVGGNAPSKYLTQIEIDDHVGGTQLDTYVSTHLIDISDLRSDNFEEYFIKRTKVILVLIGAAIVLGQMKKSIIC